MKLKITDDAKNPNNRRISIGGESLCKVYGFTPEEAQEKAEMIVNALTPALPTPEPEFYMPVEALETVMHRMEQEYLCLTGVLGKEGYLLKPEEAGRKLAELLREAAKPCTD